jgi:hypothetical protein
MGLKITTIYEYLKNKRNLIWETNYNKLTDKIFNNKETKQVCLF